MLRGQVYWGGEDSRVFPFGWVSLKRVVRVIVPCEEDPAGLSPSKHRGQRLTGILDRRVVSAIGLLSRVANEPSASGKLQSGRTAVR